MNALGMSQAAADVQKGVYSMTMTIFNMPTAFMMPITISVLPAITNHLTLGDDEAVRSTEESAARVASLISLPCSVGLLLLAGPATALLGGYEGENLVLSTKLMSVLAICISLYATVQYTTSVLQAHGKPHLPVINMLSCAVVRLGIVYLLSGNPNIGIVGVPVGAALCYGAIAVLNLVCIRMVVPQKPRLVRNLLRSALPALIMGVVVFGCNLLLKKFLGEDASRIIVCGIPIAVGVAVYAVSAVLCKSITAADCKLLPKGDKIAKLLKL
jgi:stage V sporulation protein B